MNVMLTGAVGVGKANGIGGLLGGTGLVGAVADTVAEARVGAVASNVTDGAAKVGESNANHVVEAVLLQAVASACCEWRHVNEDDLQRMSRDPAGRQRGRHRRRRETESTSL
jgi:hypothetical protein